MFASPFYIAFCTYLLHGISLCRSAHSDAMITSEVTQLLKEMDIGERNKKILTILSLYVHKSRILEANLQNCYKKFFKHFLALLKLH